MMKKIISLTLAVVMVLSVGLIAFAEGETDYTSVAYNKIVFDFSKGQVQTKDREDLELNIADMNEYCDQRANAGYEDADLVNMYVILKSEFFNQEEYLVFEQESHFLSTIEKINEWKIRYRDYSQQYHRDLYLENKRIFDYINFESIFHADYSPFVYLMINRNNVTVELLEKLALEENVVLFGIHRPYTVSDDSMDVESPCSCICHSDALIHTILWRFLTFFYRIFGINKTCECGKAHY